MKLRSVVVFAIATLFGTAAFAQDYAKVEVPLQYSYMRFNPENSSIVSGFSLNGGGGGATVYLNHFIGIETEFYGYASLNRTFVFPANTVSPCPAGCTVKASADLFTYNVGPVLKYRSEHFEPFVETLFGGAHSNSYGNIFHNVCVNPGVCGPTAKSPSNNAWDFIIGGGLDIPVTHLIAIRPAQFDFVLTRFGNSFTQGNTNQSNFRYNAGVVIRF
jgi:Outer membrane protein beta-barrel domain